MRMHDEALFLSSLKNGELPGPYTINEAWRQFDELHNKTKKLLERLKGASPDLCFTGSVYYVSDQHQNQYLRYFFNQMDEYANNR